MCFKKHPHVTIHLCFFLRNHKDTFLSISFKLSPCWNKTIAHPWDQINYKVSSLQLQSTVKSCQIQKCLWSIYFTHYWMMTTNYLLCLKSNLRSAIKNTHTKPTNKPTKKTKPNKKWPKKHNQTLQLYCYTEAGN